MIARFEKAELVTNGKPGTPRELKPVDQEPAAHCAPGAGAGGNSGHQLLSRADPDAVSRAKAVEFKRLIHQLGTRLDRAVGGQKEPYLQRLLNMADALDPGGDPAIQARLARPLCRWLVRQGRLTPAYGKTCVCLQRIAGNLIGASRLADANGILTIFNHIHSGAVKKDASLRTFTGAILKGLAHDANMQNLVAEFRTNAHNQCQEAGCSLVILGAVGAGKILPILLESNDKFDRMRIMAIIADMGPLATRSMVASLRDGGPWYYIRNLLQILGRAGDETHVETLSSLLNHNDWRVRREALDTIYKIGGARREAVLLNVLYQLDDRLKIRAVAMLGNLGSREALGPLLALVGGRSHFWNRNRRELDLMICRSLGKIGAPEAIPVLRELAARKGIWGRHFKQHLTIAARQALDQIDRYGKRTEGGGVAPAAPVFNRTAMPASRDIQACAPELPTLIKGEVGEYLRRGNTKAAVNVIYNFLLALVTQGRFDEAEALQRTLVDIDPLAFNAIVKAGAQIDAARSAAIDPEHMAVWRQFYQGLSPDEANGFFYALKERQFAPGDALITQGRTSDRLFFINRGRVKIMFQRKGGAIQLDALEGGEIAGYETFFKHTVATTSFIAAERVAASYLERSALPRFNDAVPYLTPKLHDYCLRKLKQSDIWQRKSIDRRTQLRIPLAVPVKLRVPDAQGRGIHIAYRGRLVDLSIGGAAVLVKLSRGDRARLLVGRNVYLELEAPLADIIRPARRDAVIQALRPRLVEEHILQIQFITRIKLADFLKLDELAGSL